LVARILSKESIGRQDPSSGIHGFMDSLETLKALYAVWDS